VLRRISWWLFLRPSIATSACQAFHRCALCPVGMIRANEPALPEFRYHDFLGVVISSEPASGIKEN
jgi:hypothetical protein